MSNPQYIILHVCQVINMQGAKPGTASMSILNPHVAKLFPLPMQITQEQNAAPGKARAELEMGPLVFRCVETFQDAVMAIAKACDEDICIATCPNRQAIEAASADAIVDKAMSPEEREKALQQAKEAGAVRWDEAMPMVKQDHVGDLRIIPAVGGPGFLVQQCIPVKVGDQDGTGWSLDAVTRELRRVFATESEARLAIRTAGYGRKLVEGA